MKWVCIWLEHSKLIASLSLLEVINWTTLCNNSITGYWTRLRPNLCMLLNMKLMTLSGFILNMKCNGCSWSHWYSLFIGQCLLKPKSIPNLEIFNFDLSNVLCYVPYSIIVSHKGFEIVLFMTNKPSYISSLIYRYFQLLIIVNNHFNVQVKIYIFTRDHEKCLICSMMLSVG